MSESQGLEPLSTILIVEDDPVGITSLAGILGERFELLVARTVAEAKRRLSTSVDLILLDLYLGDQTGLDFLSYIKEENRLASIPVVIISGSHNESDIENAFLKGAVDYVLKPFNRVILGAKVATFIELKKDRDLLAAAAHTDPLTGAANRRLFDKQLATEWHRAQRYQSLISLILVDLDHFKAVNDTHGHLGGDRCLVSLSRIMQRTIGRAEDIVARLGGDEFAAILPNTPLKNTVLVGNRLRGAIAQWGDGDSNDAEECPRFTTSIGCAAMVPSEGSSSSELIHAADRELYRAKQVGGRNCVSPLPQDDA